MEAPCIIVPSVMEGRDEPVVVESKAWVEVVARREGAFRLLLRLHTRRRLFRWMHDEQKCLSVHPAPWVGTTSPNPTSIARDRKKLERRRNSK